MEGCEGKLINMSFGGGSMDLALPLGLQRYQKDALSRIRLQIFLVELADIPILFPRRSMIV